MHLPKPSASHVGRFLRSGFRKYSKQFWSAAAVMLIGVGLQYVFPYLTVFIIDVVLPSKNLSLLSSVILICVLLYLAIGISDSLSGLWFHYSREKVLQDLQLNVFEHAQYLFLQDFERIANENICSYLIKDVHNLRGLLADTIFFLAKDLLTIMVGLFLIFHLNWFMACLVLPIIACVFGTSIFTGRRIRNRIGSYHSAMGKFMSSLMRSLFNFYFVKIYSIEDSVRERIRSLQKRQFALSYKLEILRYASGGLVRFLASLPPLLVFWYGGLRIMEGTFTFGQLVGFNFILSYILGASQHLANTNLDIESARASLGRLSSFLELPNEKHQVGIGFPAQLHPYLSLSFEDISFSYDGRRPVLQHVSFSVSPGEIVALVGRNGSGKSTLLKLLLKLYDRYEGTIRLNDFDIKHADRFAVRRMIAVVPQDVFIFEGSVKENILIGCPGASDAEIVEAARSARIHEVIELLPSSYDTQLDTERVPFSGGQKQQLALARALVRQARILVLDEATSQVDSKSEYLIRDIVQQFAQKKVAVLIIAHRLSTVASADKIVVLEEGRILDIGKHCELYHRCAAYRQFADYQLIKPPFNESVVVS